MAWIGLIAVIGLVLCGLDAIVDTVRARRPPRDERADRSAPRRRGLLVLAGVLAGVVILAVVASQIFGGGGSGGGSGAGSGSTSSQTPTSRSERSQKVHVEVINASGVPKAAAGKAQALSTLGYLIAGTGNAARAVGTTVACRTAFIKDAKALARDVGLSATVQSFPTPAPSGAEGADCIVVLGA